MNREFIINKSSHKLARSLLRNNQTLTEKILWNELKNKKLGVWFKRQVSINKFIVDFYCPKVRLVIELDGSIHNKKLQADYDKQREWYLKSMNFRVIRFKNEEIINNFETVISKIKIAITPPPLD